MYRVESYFALPLAVFIVDAIRTMSSMTCWHALVLFVPHNRHLFFFNVLTCVLPSNSYVNDFDSRRVRASLHPAAINRQIMESSFNCLQLLNVFFLIFFKQLSFNSFDRFCFFELDSSWYWNVWSLFMFQETFFCFSLFFLFSLSFSACYALFVGLFQNISPPPKKKYLVF